MVYKCQLSVLLPEDKRPPRCSCTVDPSPSEKQDLLFYSANGKESIQHLLACILHKTALNVHPFGSQTMPHKKHL